MNGLIELKSPTQNNHCIQVRQACAAMRKDGTSYEHLRWQQAPIHHRKIILFMAGCEDERLSERGWDLLPSETRQSVVGFAREIAGTVSVVKAFQK